MPNNKLKDNEIIKALEDWIKYYDGDGSYAHFKTLENALDLINHLQAQNKDLSETVHKLTLEKDALFDKLDKLKSEVDRYSINNHEYANCVGIKNGLIYTHTLDDYENFIEDVSNIAVKEFAEKLKKRIYKGGVYPTVEDEFMCDIDNLVKEMIDDDNA